MHVIDNINIMKYSHTVLNYYKKNYLRLRIQSFPSSNAVTRGLDNEVMGTTGCDCTVVSTNINLVSGSVMGVSNHDTYEKVKVCEQ